MGEFLMNNLGLVALFLASGLMLVWAEISKRAGMGGPQIGTLEATRLMNQGGSLVLDIREAADYATGHLPKARHIPLSQLSKRVDEIVKCKDKPVIVTCRNGAKAGAAARLLKQ